MELAILGAGAWGSALAKLAQEQGHSVHLWSRRSPESLADILAAAEIAISAVSISGVTPIAAQLSEMQLPADLIVVSATKGLDPVTTQTPSQLWQAALPNHAIAVLSGPNLSEEIGRGLPAATVVASTDIHAAERIQKALSSEHFRIYTNTDPIGTELGGTLKNVIAIAAGVCDGLHLGTNAKAALLTRALAEMIRIGVYLGGKAETFFGLAGLGDLLATCSSSLSRNYRVGYGLAQGKSIDQILAELQSTAEGINTTNVLIQIADREGITVPISGQVYRLLNGQITARQAVEALMERDLKSEL